jgi:magnesium-transporting ATPase (P-type)
MSGLPSAVVVYISFLLTISLARLNRKNIISTHPEKIVEGSRMSLICFDKTGTLTEK